MKADREGRAKQKSPDFESPAKQKTEDREIVAGDFQHRHEFP
jgi:hypothetical protein